MRSPWHSGLHCNKGVVLGSLDRSDEALAAYEQVIADYGDDPAPALRKQIATAVVNKGVYLSLLGCSDDAVAGYQQVIADYGDDPDLRGHVATALVNNGDTLRSLGRSDEALAAYQQVITDYGDDPAPALVREAIALATAALEQEDQRGGSTVRPGSPPPLRPLGPKRDQPG